MRVYASLIISRRSSKPSSRRARIHAVVRAFDRYVEHGEIGSGSVGCPSTHHGHRVLGVTGLVEDPLEDQPRQLSPAKPASSSGRRYDVTAQAGAGGRGLMTSIARSSAASASSFAPAAISS